MKRLIQTSLLLLVLSDSSTLADAGLLVKTGPPKITGRKAVMRIELKNTYDLKIESVRATVFLLDEQGRPSGQMTRWVIGGTKDQPALAPGGERVCSVVVPIAKPFTETRVAVNRVVLEGGKLADLAKDVAVSVAKDP